MPFLNHCKSTEKSGTCIRTLLALSEVPLFFGTCLVLLDLIVLRVFIIIDNIKNSNTWPVYSKHLYFVRSGRNNLRHDIVVTRLSSNVEYAKL